MSALLDHPGAKAVAGISSFLALFIAIYQIICHLGNYTGPVYQRYIVRIIFLVPLYALLSFLSLLMPHNSPYFDSVRDVYEAFVIYCFLSLCLAYVGGPGSVEVKMHGQVLFPSWLYCTCCLPPLPVNGRFVRICKQGALQFVLVKPILAIITVVLYTQGKYVEGNWGPNNGYLWVTIVYNLTYTTALYALLLFYLGTHDLLAPFNPLAKFAVVKGVVFFTFWQGLAIAILQAVGVIQTVEDGKNLQNFVICLEMLPAALGMLAAFSYKEFKGSGPSAGVGLDSMRHVFSIHDVVSDTVHQFAPTYHDYVLYSNGGSKDPPKKQTVRAKTFVSVGQETTRFGRGRAGSGKEEANSDLLSNVELGVHAKEGAGGQAGSSGPGLNGGSRQMTGEETDFYGRSLAADEDGIELSSAEVPEGPPAGGKKGKKKPRRALVRRENSEEEEDLPSGAVLETEELPAAAPPPPPRFHPGPMPRPAAPSGPAPVLPAMPPPPQGGGRSGSPSKGAPPPARGAAAPAPTAPQRAKDWDEVEL